MWSDDELGSTPLIASSHTQSVVTSQVGGGAIAEDSRFHSKVSKLLKFIHFLYVCNVNRLNPKWLLDLHLLNTTVLLDVSGLSVRCHLQNLAVFSPYCGLKMDIVRCTVTVQPFATSDFFSLSHSFYSLANLLNKTRYVLCYTYGSS